MNIKIILNNYKYNWKSIIINDVSLSIKGNIFFENKYVEAVDLCKIFMDKISQDSKRTSESICPLIQNLEGDFAIIFQTPEILLCVVDRLRTIPIYYRNNELETVLSDCSDDLIDNSTIIDQKNVLEFLHTGYVMGRETIYQNIFQLQAGELLFYSKQIKKMEIWKYFYPTNKIIENVTEHMLLSQLDTVFNNVFLRLKQSTVDKGKFLVVPLSGGLDSRIIVALLKKYGITDVICFSYGRLNNAESKISKKVADALGYEWIFIEYTNDKWKDIYSSEILKTYYKYASNSTSLPHIQDFLAVKFIKENQLVPSNSTFVPGHTGDMISGGHIPGDLLNRNVYNNDLCAEEVINYHFLNQPNKDSKQNRRLLKNKIRNYISEIIINNAESYANGFEYFDFMERQSKFIINSVRTYEFFEYEWRLPLWDTQLIKFFKRVPLKYKIHQYLYKKYCLTYLFVDNLYKLKDIECTTNLNLAESNSEKMLMAISGSLADSKFVLDYKNKLIDVKENVRAKIVENEIYKFHPLAYYGFIEESRFLSEYHLRKNVNSFLTADYVSNLYQEKN
ncbi:MAG: 7-cyano-7-deazaguanine synthase [Methanomassiliicoccales archaeon PtaU1.Bin124]|nr:MAG: 7-cyano-7-deazaguanine synthase [Methanomassiliicoccales archaeon PtaU1.Bin124]